MKREDRASEEILKKYGPHGSGRSRGRDRIPFLVFFAGILVLIVGICALLGSCKKDRSGGSSAVTAERTEAAYAAVSPSPDAALPAETPVRAGPDPTPETGEVAEGHYVQGDESDYRLRLVNAWNPMDPSWEPSRFTQLRNGQSVDERCYPDLQAMMDACRAAGNHPLIVSSYRTADKQSELYNGRVNELIAGGMGDEEARAEAARTVAAPDRSEHRLGLACDIVDSAHQILDTEQEGTPTQRWLLEHSWEYGFILRFPKEKEAVTGIAYEPWHYRYVGRDAAGRIRESGLCLEEYLEAGEQDSPEGGTQAVTPGAGRDELREKIGRFPIRLMHTPGQELYQFTLTETEAERLVAGPTYQHEKKGLAWTFENGILTVSGEWEEQFRFNGSDKSFTSLTDGASYRSFPAE